MTEWITALIMPAFFLVALGFAVYQAFMRDRELRKGNKR